MKRLAILAAAIVISVAPFAVQAVDSWGLEEYTTELQLKIATAISPRSPPIRMQVTRSAGARPFLYGTTSLPDGAILQVSLRKPWLPDARERLSIGLPACKISCMPPGTPRYSTGDRVIIKNGAFQMGPFSFGSDPLDPGVYPFEILVETGNFSGSTDVAFPKVYSGQIVIGPDDR